MKRMRSYRCFFFFVAIAIVCTASPGEKVTDALNPTKRVVVIGDVHGDLPQLLAILQMADVVDRDGHWIATNSTTVVQVGDLLDRGPNDKEVMDFFINLKTEAMNVGARVVNLLGNHEHMNLASQFHYVHPESNEVFGGKHKRRHAFSQQGLYGKFLSALPLVHIEGRSLFVHAGLSPRFAQLGVQAINDQSHNALSVNDFNHRIFGNTGPIWTRLLITDAINNRCTDIVETLRILDVDRMIVGHTPERNGRIGSYCDDRMLAVDVGMSKWMYGSLAALEITHLDQDGRNVELREILPVAAGEKQSATDASDDDDDETNKKKIINDPMLLQEMLDVLHEYEQKDKVRDEL